MAGYWQTIEFKTRQEQLNWYERNKDKYQIEEVFIDNAWGYDYKPLLKL